MSERVGHTSALASGCSFPVCVCVSRLNASNNFCLFVLTRRFPWTRVRSADLVQGSSALGKRCGARGSWEPSGKRSHAPTASACPTCDVCGFSEELDGDGSATRSPPVPRSQLTQRVSCKKRENSSPSACLCVWVCIVCVCYTVEPIFSKDPRIY